MDTELLAENLATEDISSSGNTCNFMDMGNGHGIKCFLNLHSMETAYTVQKFFAALDMAPLVGKKFELIDYNGDTWFCYPTEVAKTLVPYGVENSHAFSDSRMDYVGDYNEYLDLVDCSEENSMMERDARDNWLHDCYKETGYDYTDDHVGNWGWITRAGEEKLVVIDFDTCHKIYSAILNGNI